MDRWGSGRVNEPLDFHHKHSSLVDQPVLYDCRLLCSCLTSPSMRDTSQAPVCVWQGSGFAMGRMGMEEGVRSPCPCLCPDRHDESTTAQP